MSPIPTRLNQLNGYPVIDWKELFLWVVACQRPRLEFRFDSHQVVSFLSEQTIASFGTSNPKRKKEQWSHWSRGHVHECEGSHSP